MPPEALILVVSPGQTVEEVVLMIAGEYRFTVTIFVSAQVPEVPITVYVVFVVGVAVTDAPVAELRDVDGDQE